MEPSASTASVLSSTGKRYKRLHKGAGQLRNSGNRRRRRTQRRFYGVPAALMVAALYPRQRKNGAKVLVLSLPPAPSLSFFPPTSAKPLVALRFAGDTQDGATAKVAVAIAIAPDPGPCQAGRWRRRWQGGPEEEDEDRRRRQEADGVSNVRGRPNRPTTNKAPPAQSQQAFFLSLSQT